MTAYGRSFVVSALGRIVVELHSVNRKHLEINTHLPKELLRYDADIKKWIGMQVGRGQINVKISVYFEQACPLIITPNLALARQLKDVWQIIADDLKMPFDHASFFQMLALENGLLHHDEDAHDEALYREVLSDSVNQALKQFVAMKLLEGKALYDDVSLRFAKLSVLLKEVSVKAPGATTRYRQKLIERLEEIMGGASVEIEERILREVGIYAERVDIVEEVIRFESHLQQVQELMAGKESSIGKTLEFLLQELNREINTIGSKSSDVEVSRLAIEMKGELERIREQIQNVE